jgi:hypothetical protein
METAGPIVTVVRATLENECIVPKNFAPRFHDAHYSSYGSRPETAAITNRY